MSVCTSSHKTRFPNGTHPSKLKVKLIFYWKTWSGHHLLLLPAQSNIRSRWMRKSWFLPERVWFLSFCLSRWQTAVAHTSELCSLKENTRQMVNKQNRRNKYGSFQINSEGIERCLAWLWYWHRAMLLFHVFHLWVLIRILIRVSISCTPLHFPTWV